MLAILGDVMYVLVAAVTLWMLLANAARASTAAARVRDSLAFAVLTAVMAALYWSDAGRFWLLGMLVAVSVAISVAVVVMPVGARAGR